MKLEPQNQISSTHDSIARILNEYAISDFTFKSINEGISNTSFIIEDQKNKYVLRVYAQDSKTSDEIIFEIEFQDYLREHGIPIPLIYKNTLGGELSILEIDGKKWQCILMQFVEGKSVTVHPLRPLVLQGFKKGRKQSNKRPFLGRVFYLTTLSLRSTNFR